MKDIFYIVAQNMLKWSPEERLRIKDKLTSAYERECLRQAFERIIRGDTIDALVDRLITAAKKTVSV